MNQTQCISAFCGMPSGGAIVMPLGLEKLLFRPTVSCTFPTGPDKPLRFFTRFTSWKGNRNPQRRSLRMLGGWTPKAPKASIYS
jgi:hypothetical protein